MPPRTRIPHSSEADIRPQTSYPGPKLGDAVSSDLGSPAKEKSATLYPRLLSYDELPKWFQDNESIRRGYRPISGSMKVSLCSLLYIHNESVNIYSHLISAVAFMLSEGLILRYLHNNYVQISLVDDLIFTFFILTAISCLTLSSCYHALLNHSMKIDSLMLRVDFSGIMFLTLGDMVSGIYMVFWCEPFQRRTYWTVIIVLEVVDICFLLGPKFQGRAWHSYRLSCFVVTGLSGFAPLIHGVYIFGLPQMMKQSGMPYYLTEGGFLLFGVFFYVTRVPERLSPGRFDIYGASHQLFHVFVVLGTCTHLLGIMSAYDYNYNYRVCQA